MAGAKPIPWAMRIDLVSNDDPRDAVLEVAIGADTAEATKALADGIIARRPEVQAIWVYQPDNQKLRAQLRAQSKDRAQLWVRYRGEAWRQIS